MANGVAPGRNQSATTASVVRKREGPSLRHVRTQFLIWMTLVGWRLLIDEDLRDRTVSDGLGRTGTRHVRSWLMISTGELDSSRFEPSKRPSSTACFLRAKIRVVASSSVSMLCIRRAADALLAAIRSAMARSARGPKIARRGLKSGHQCTY